MSGLQVPPNCDLTLGLLRLDTSGPAAGWQMTADERFANPAGILQGGFVAALCDSAMGASAVTAAIEGGRKISCANAEMKVSFLHRVATGSVLTCTPRVLSGGARLVFCEADVHDGEGRLVAKASSTYVITPRGPGRTDDGC
ncbi:MAG: PaaI family thioesterase [Acidimicrobiales bacterium]